MANEREVEVLAEITQRIGDGIEHPTFGTNWDSYWRQFAENLLATGLITVKEKIEASDLTAIPDTPEILIRRTYKLLAADHAKVAAEGMEDPDTCVICCFMRDVEEMFPGVLDPLKTNVERLEEIARKFWQQSARGFTGEDVDSLRDFLNAHSVLAPKEGE